MELKTLNWTLALVIIACSLNAVLSDDKHESSSTVSSFSSSSFERRAPSHGVQGQRRRSGNATQVHRRVVSKRYNRVPKSVVVRTSHHVYINRTEVIVVNASSINIFPTYQYVQVEQYVKIIPSYVILSLQIADRFRSNVIYILGYLLQSRNSELTLQQYSSLKLIYTALQRKQVQMYRLLPALINLRDKSKSIQLGVIMQELSKYLPMYYSCSAAFWVGQMNHYNLDAVLGGAQEEFNLFNSISAREIEVVRNFNGSYEKESYDENSRVTEAMLGSVYVKIFQSLNIHQLHLSQQLFAIILRNLPNPDGDVAFEEYIQLVAEVAWRQEIPNWEQIGINPNAINPFLLIKTVGERISGDEKVSTIIRQAIDYIKLHLWSQQEYVMNARDTYLITGEGGLNFAYLLSVINFGEFNRNAVEQKEILLDFAYNHRDVIEYILRGMNRYAYITTQELLQAFLIRLRTRLPVEYVEIRQVVFRLLVIVERKITVWRPDIPNENTTPQPSITEEPTGSTESTPSAQPVVTDHPSNHTEEGTTVTHPGTEEPTGSTESTPSAQPVVTDHPSNHTEEGITVTHPGTEEPTGSTESTPSAQPVVTDHPSNHTEEGTTVTHPGTEEPTGSTESTPSAQPVVTDHPSNHTEEGTTVTHPGTEEPTGSTESTPSAQPVVTDHPSNHTEEGTTVTHPGTEEPTGSTESTPSAQPVVTDHPSNHTEEGTTVTHPGTEEPTGSTESTPSAQPVVTDHPSNHTEEGITVTHPGTEEPTGSTESTPSAQPVVTDHPSNHTEEGTTVTHPGTEEPTGSTESTPSAQPVVTDHPSNHTEEGTTVTHPGTEEPTGSTESTPSAQPVVTDHPSNHTEEGTTVTHPGTEEPTGSTESTPSAQPVVTDHPSNHTEEGTTVTHPGTEEPTGSTESTPSAQPVVTDHPSNHTEEGTTVTHPGTEEPTGSTESTPSAQPVVTVNGSTVIISTTTARPTESPTIGPIIPRGDPPVPEGVDVLQVIYMEITEFGIPIFEFGSTNHSSNGVTVPSPDCLRSAPTNETSQANCQTDTEIYITTQLISIFGNDYIRVILGEHWEERYPTTISYLIAILEKVENNEKIQGQQELIIIIKRYKIAIKTIATYVFLPLIVQQQKITTTIVWSTFDSSNPSTSYIGSFRPTDIGTNIITVPLVNPITWVTPVDLNDPYNGLFPVLPADHPDAHNLDILIQIFTTGDIRQWLGKEWNPSVYPNRGALFITALRILLTTKEVTSNTDLYILIRNYLRAIELPAVNTEIQTSYWTHTVLRTRSTVMIIPDIPKPVPEINLVIPQKVNPNTTIQLAVSDRFVPSIELLATYKGNMSIPNVVYMPSVVCLLQAPSTGNAQDRCEVDFDVQIRNIFIQTFGERYIEMILGDNAVHIYPTRISLLIALLERVQNNTQIMHQVEILHIIRKYEIALKSVVSYILLPLTVHYQNITNIVIWFTYDPKNPSQINNITEVPTYQEDENIITLPLINPITWVLEVHGNKPFSGLIPMFQDRQSPYAIQIEPLNQLITSGDILDLLGPNFEVSRFPNRGALYTAVLYKLLTVEKVIANQRLYTLLKQYLTVFELQAINIHITTAYIETMVSRWNYEYKQFVEHEDPIVANATVREDILFSALIIPNKDLKVTMKSSTRIFVQSSKVLEQLSPDTLTLPSVYCLQAFPDQDDDEYCEQFPDLPMLPQLRKTLGDEGTEKMMNENWDSEYPTMVSFLQNLCLKAVQNEKVANNTELVADIERYRAALEFSAATIFLPLLTNYQAIDVELIWLTYDTTNFRLSHMSLHRPEKENPNVITLPLVNPKVWLQSVNVDHPFASFLPILPASDPYAVKIKPLVKLFNSGEIFLILGKYFTPANYPNRGALFIAALHTLLNSPSVVSNKELHPLVKNYFNVIQVVSLYVHIPRSRINSGYRKAQYRWTVDVADLYTALPDTQTREEDVHHYVLRLFLAQTDLLQILQIHLPTLSTYKAEFLMMIIHRVLTSYRQVFDSQIITALEYYSAKAELALVARGGVVRWIWVARTQGRIISKSVMSYDIGKIYINTIPLSRLRTKEAKVDYFKLIKFMNDNREFLNTDDFIYKRYANHGHFLRAYLNHLVQRPNIDEDAKEYILNVVEFIRNTGPGAVPIQ